MVFVLGACQSLEMDSWAKKNGHGWCWVWAEHSLWELPKLPLWLTTWESAGTNVNRCYWVSSHSWETQKSVHVATLSTMLEIVCKLRKLLISVLVRTLPCSSLTSLQQGIIAGNLGKKLRNLLLTGMSRTWCQTKCTASHDSAVLCSLLVPSRTTSMELQDWCSQEGLNSSSNRLVIGLSFYGYTRSSRANSFIKVFSNR